MPNVGAALLLKIVGIVQQRTGSTRLPGKALLPLAGASLTQRLLERLQRSVVLDRLILAVPFSEPADFAFCARLDVPVMRPMCEDADLVTRHRIVAETHHADLIIRVPGDNPCVDPAYVDAAIAHYAETPQVFYSNTTACVNGQYLDGIGAEVWSISRLRWLDGTLAKDDPRREHPHQLFYDAGLGPVVPHGTAVLRLDVNTRADYEFIAGLYDRLYPTNPHFTAHDILDALVTKEVCAHAAL